MLWLFSNIRMKETREYTVREAEKVMPSRTLLLRLHVKRRSAYTKQPVLTSQCGSVYMSESHSQAGEQKVVWSWEACMLMYRFHEFGNCCPCL